LSEGALNSRHTERSQADYSDDFFHRLLFGVQTLTSSANTKSKAVLPELSDQCQLNLEFFCVRGQDIFS
jgi:hypothetical protein